MIAQKLPKQAVDGDVDDGDDDNNNNNNNNNM
jgi:hypothetical protein